MFMEKENVYIPQCQLKRIKIENRKTGERKTLAKQTIDWTERHQPNGALRNTFNGKNVSSVYTTLRCLDLYQFIVRMPSNRHYLTYECYVAQIMWSGFTVDGSLCRPNSDLINNVRPVLMFSRSLHNTITLYVYLSFTRTNKHNTHAESESERERENPMVRHLLPALYFAIVRTDTQYVNIAHRNNRALNIHSFLRLSV